MEKPLHVLIVEDSPDDAELLVAELQRGGYDVRWQRVETATAVKAALDSQPWDLVISDHALFQFDSLAALQLLKASRADAPFIIVSGTIGEEQAVEAMRAGASDYLVKGRLARLLPVVERELAEVKERRARRAAEQTMREHEQGAALELALAYEATIEGWAHALDLRDRETEGHSRRVTDLTVRLARAMGISESECVHIRRGALLHDIGKMGIPDSILLKPSPLTAEEWTIMQRHPQYARELLAPIAYLQRALDIPYCHHEKWDGSGYPRGLAGQAIPLAARLFAVVDIWDAVRSDRPYRPAWPEAKARQHIAALAGTHLDPDVVDAFFTLLASFDTTPQADHRVVATRQTRILVVDDYGPNIKLLQRWLCHEGYDVLSAESGQGALAAVARHQPSLVLLDVEIPDHNGFEVCLELKRNPATATLPVIFLSALDLSAHPAATRAGADAWLMKPVDVFELRACIRRHLGQREREPAFCECEGLQS